VVTNYYIDRVFRKLNEVERSESMEKAGSSSPATQTVFPAQQDNNGTQAQVADEKRTKTGGNQSGK